MFLFQNAAPGGSLPCLSLVWGVSFCTSNIFLLLYRPQCILILLIFCSCLFFKIGFLRGRNRFLYNWTPVPSKMPRKLLNISTLVTEVLRSSDPRPSLYLSLFYHFAFTAHPGSRFLSFFSQMSAVTSLLTTEIPPLSPCSVFST